MLPGRICQPEYQTSELKAVKTLCIWLIVDRKILISAALKLIKTTAELAWSPEANLGKTMLFYNGQRDFLSKNLSVVFESSNLILS